MSDYQPIHWSTTNQTRVPDAVYQQPDVLAQEQKKIYEGPTWS